MQARMVAAVAKHWTSQVLLRWRVRACGGRIVCKTCFVLCPRRSAVLGVTPCCLHEHSQDKGHTRSVYLHALLNVGSLDRDANCNSATAKVAGSAGCPTFRPNSSHGRRSEVPACCGGGRRRLSKSKPGPPACSPLQISTASSVETCYSWCEGPSPALVLHDRHMPAS